MQSVSGKYAVSYHAKQLNFCVRVWCGGWALNVMEWQNYLKRDFVHYVQWSLN